MRWVFIVVVVLALYGGCGGSSDQPPRPKDQATLCVDVVDNPRVSAQEATNAIETALLEVSKHPILPLAYPGSSPIVDESCPVGPAPTNSAGRVAGRSVGRASYYSVFIYIVPEEVIQRRFKSPDWRLSTEEFVCHGDTCAGETNGLYFSPEDLERTNLVIDMLEKGIGLEPSSDPLEPGHHPQY